MTNRGASLNYNREASEVPPVGGSWEDIQESRRRAINENCINIQKEDLLKALLTDKASRKYLLVDDEHRAIYCFIPKVASINWRRTWMLLTKMTSDVKSMTRERLEEALVNKTLKTVLKKDEVLHKLTSYTKIIVVRNPLERLLSVYLDEVRDPKKLGNTVIRFIRKRRPEAKIPDITWQEFVDFIITEGVIDSKYFLPLEDICHPCAINYDYIIKFETFQNDTRNVLRILGAEESEQVEGPPLHDTRVDLDVFRMYSESLSMRKLEALKRKYDRDLRLFQYSRT